MTQIKDLLVHQLNDLLDAETRLTEALPKMAEAASHPKLREAFEKHLEQTEGQVERLHKAFQALGEEPKPEPCKGMMGLIEEGDKIIQEADQSDSLAADLALIAAAQKVEHYEIASYGTARSFARQLGETDCARLLSHSLGEEESADFLLTLISDPLIQQLSLNDQGASVNLDAVENRSQPIKKKSARQKAA